MGKDSYRTFRRHLLDISKTSMGWDGSENCPKTFGKHALDSALCGAREIYIYIYIYPNIYIYGVCQHIHMRTDTNASMPRLKGVDQLLFHSPGRWIRVLGQCVASIGTRRALPPESCARHISTHLQLYAPDWHRCIRMGRAKNLAQLPY